MRVAFSVAVLAACFAAPVVAQEPIDGHTFLPEARWGKLGADAHGQRFYLEGRWHEVFGDKVFLFRADASRGFLIIPEGEPLRAVLLKDRDSKLQPLESGKSRVRVFGTAARGGGGAILRVTAVDRLPSDVEVLQRRLEELGDDPRAYEALATEAERLAARYADEELRDLANRITRRELTVRREALEEGDHAGALALAERMVHIGDRRAAIDLLSDLEARTDGGLRQVVRQQLERLGAIRSGDSWIPYEVYKRGEGFVRREVDGRERWVRRAYLELERERKTEIERQLNQVALPRVNPVQAMQDAEAGRIARGQNMPEVRVAAGLPVDVFHERAPDANGQPVRWSQWFMADGARIYFMEGQVIAVVGEDSELPGE